jgi:hypothetical protein
MVPTQTPPLPACETADNPQAAAAAALIKGADALVAAGDREGALWSYRKASEIFETLAAADPVNVEWHRGLSVSQNRIGDMLAAAGDRQGAIQAKRQGALRARVAAALLRKRGGRGRQNSDLVSEQGVQDSGVPGKPTTPAGTAAQSRPRSALQVPGAGHELTRPAPAADHVQWPSEKWKGSPEELSRKAHSLVLFLRRVWKPFIDANYIVVTRAMIAEHDEYAAAAIKEYVKARPLPEDIHIVRTRDIKGIALAFARHAYGE